jgi:hypothetical protein
MRHGRNDDDIREIFAHVPICRLTIDPILHLDGHCVDLHPIRITKETPLPTKRLRCIISFALLSKYQVSLHNPTHSGSFTRGLRSFSWHVYVSLSFRHTAEEST